MKKVLFLIGTRPEAIKLAPLVKVFQQDSKIETKVCLTAQHREMLDQVLQFFGITADHDLDLMQPGQRLGELTARILTGLDEYFAQYKPDLVFVQGDTTTVAAGSLSCFYHRIPVAHVEAGLRSHNKDAPFPEEMNRLLTSRIATLHFAPTSLAVSNLRAEGISDHVYQTGNTVVDALKTTLEIVGNDEARYAAAIGNYPESKRIILVTCHRRESFGKPLQNIFTALNAIAERNPDVELIYPVHLNPNITTVAKKLLTSKNIRLLAPLDYPSLVWLMKKSFLIITDSGGIQEEAPSLGKPVVVLREVTERSEGIEAGCVRLVGTETDNILSHVTELLTNETAYNNMCNARDLYGDGHASEKIYAIVKKQLL